MLRAVSRFLKINQPGALRRTIGLSSRLCGQETKGEDIIVKSDWSSIEIPNETIDKFVWKNLDKFHDKVALVRNLVLADSRSLKNHFYQFKV